MWWTFCTRHDRTFRCAGACNSNEKCRRLWVPAFGCGFCAPMLDRAIPMPEDRSLALAARSDSGCRRPLHGIHGVIDRMQGPPCPFDCFRRHRPLHGATRVHGTADTARNKQPGEEAHPKSQATKWLCWKTTPAATLAPINTASNACKPTYLPRAGSRQAIPPSTVIHRPVPAARTRAGQRLGSAEGAPAGSVPGRTGSERPRRSTRLPE